jgi:hypothetical protein
MRITRLLTLAVAVAVVGCSGRGERGKNQDFDVPKPAAKG